MTENQNVLHELEQILRSFVPQEQEINKDTDLVADLDLDSLKVMKILEAVEDRFDISIPLNIMPDVRTVEDFVIEIQKLNGDE
jgi:acyl carrier protein